MTRVDGRDRRSAAEQLGELIRRLQTDRIDLLQFHKIIREDDPERIFAEGGAREALLEARDGGGRSVTSVSPGIKALLFT